jgi:hypothetical protein
MTSIDFDMAQAYHKVYQARELMQTYLDEWETILEQIENQHVREKSMVDLNLSQAFVDEVGELMISLVKYRALNPYGSENQRLRDELWRAKKYIQSLGGDWTTILWTTKADYL